MKEKVGSDAERTDFVLSSFARAVDCHRAGHLSQAESLYRKVLEIDAAHFGSLANLGNLCRQSGAIDEAIDLLRRATDCTEITAEVHLSLGRLLQSKGDEFAEARRHFDAALALRPDLKAAHIGRLTLVSRDGKFDAIRLAQEALRAFPEDTEIAFEVGKSMVVTGEHEQALVYLRRTLSDGSLSARQSTDLASALISAGAGAEAVDVLRRVVEVAPKTASAWFNLATALRQTNHLNEAITAFRRSAALDNKGVAMTLDEAGCLVRLRRGEDVRGYFDTVVAAGGTEPGTSTALMAALYDDDRGAEEVRDRHQAATKSWPVVDKRPAAPAYRAEVPVAVAFLSGDFQGGHPVAQFMIPLLERLPALGVMPKVYLTATATDPTANWLKRSTPTESLVGLDDEEAAAMIAADQPSLLIDLAGHTNGNRLKILGQRPAPLTATFLGYPSTTGYAGVDVLVADPVLVPSEHEHYYSENIARLPNSFLCFAVPPGMPEPDPAPIKGRRLRFGSLNAHAKINDRTLRLWARVLAEVPGAELFVKCGEFAEKTTRAAFARRASAYGIASERLILEGPETFADAMKAYRGIDVALDPMPYNGGTTTCHALFMGTPVVTLAGDRFSARMGASVLNAADLKEWVAEDENQYIAIASALAADREALHATRCGLPSHVKSSALGRIDRYAADLRHCAEVLQRLLNSSEKRCQCKRIPKRRHCRKPTLRERPSICSPPTSKSENPKHPDKSRRRNLRLPPRDFLKGSLPTPACHWRSALIRPAWSF